MLWLRFAGWFQCRLATDPDPCDEPRGVSGYAHALAGEPDLDRTIRLQPAGAFRRSHCPEIGVTVRAVLLDNAARESHPLIGAPVDLLGEPKFEGRNGIVAEDGLEPVVPFVLSVAAGGAVCRRAHADEERFPFSDLQAQGVQPAPAAIGQATGITDLRAVWRQRAAALEADLPTASPADRVAGRRRLQMLRDGRLAGFFGVRLLYAFALRGRATIDDPDGILGDVDADAPWPIDFWLGGWDADAFCGFMSGAVGLPIAGTPVVPTQPSRP